MGKAITPKEAANLLTRKRGRPAKNKSNIDSFAETLKEWDEMEKINWEEVAKKQETKLYVYMEENEQIAKIAQDRWNEIQQLKYLISYLESRIEDLTVRSR